ncbi:TPA: streptothricin N-acetyltransferase SatA [Bacillus cereus]|jgi:ribosomal protein S18 acetylase RimI-like enzyme|uniref:Putative streptothricin acetyltransferase n=1 Tax=Bacillus cereus (strain B4264) TaxID=405532 RepID=B7HAF4_BACC4|nr:streptothricin N-acetyltransferase SatA [Bacillus cereus]ACK64036.1 putative streptothricin acetyltransferase [Bacillus cereus B4264]MBH0321357.1 streptothricin N-acetyltransferase SatA [Bacillus cereus]MDA2177824.1 streptothricin N-acetyltransferase SatA [Bacillus cereus]MEB2587525.1 streptothricin N-acetyltransferase SatA [Bacillus cereus]MEB2612875.1 streptothricin N-acetyltransferase SatA [Bacillus cereus]
MNLVIRELETNDLDNLPEIDDSFIVNARLILSLSKGNRCIKYTAEDVPSYEKSYLQNQDDNEELPYNEYINKPNQVIYIALLHNQIIGLMVLKKNWNHYAYIEDITVDKKYRTLGVGKRLVDQAKQWAKKGNMPGIMLETQNNNVAACKFYEKCGFVIGGFDFLVYKGLDIENDEVAIYWYLHFDS